MVEETIKAQTDDKYIRQIVLTARFANLEQVRQFVIEAAEECGMKPKTVFAVELAVDEAFSNIIDHAYGGESQELIECTCQSDEDRLIIKLKDCGEPFRPNGVPQPNLDACLEERKIGGLGLHFMRQLMDEVSYSFSTGPGNRVNCNSLTMVKYKER